MGNSRPGSGAMLEAPGYIAADERDLLTQAAGWPGCRSGGELTGAALAEVTAARGVDFATALLYERMRRSDRHGPFIRRIDGLLDEPPRAGAKVDVLLAVAPGMF